MLNLKKTAVAVLAFGSSAVFAGTMGPVCTASNVTVPCETTGWGVGIYALYLQPTYSGVGNFSIEEALPAGDFVAYGDADPRWTWGFKLEGIYLFSTGNDLNLNWTHLGRRSERAVFAYDIDFLLDDVLVALEGTQVLYVRPRWDAVNLEFGQHVDFGEFKDIRFHAGVQYARISTNTTLNLVDADAVPITGVELTGNSRYNGFGPRLGMDMSYNIGNGLAVYGNGAAAILAGTSKLNQTAVVVDTTGTAVAAATRTTDHTAIVPELEAKLGITYGYAMPSGELTLDLGYMWVNYFNAQQFAGLSGGRHYSDFGVQGPYLGLRWVGVAI